MSFRTTLALFKTTKTQVCKLKARISTIYHSAFQKSGKKIHKLLSLIALSVWENYRRAYNLFCQITPFLLSPTAWFAKEFPASHPSDKLQREDEGSYFFFNLPLHDALPKVGLQKISLESGRSTLILQKRWRKITQLQDFKDPEKLLFWSLTTPRQKFLTEN